jgi:hemerythrin
MNEYMPWREDYSVGNDSIDEEHKQILELINDLHRVVVLQRREDSVAVNSVLEQLMHYTVRHFQHEEEIMRACGYPGLEEHKALHGRLRRRTAAMRTNMFLVTDRDMLSYLKEWWHHHIIQQDQGYAPYLSVMAR